MFEVAADPTQTIAEPIVGMGRFIHEAVAVERQVGHGIDPGVEHRPLAAGLGKVNPSLVKTSFGYHIVKLEGERPGKTLPKDFDKESAKYVQQYVDRIAQAKVGEVIAAEQPKLTVEILDPGMRAAMATLALIYLLPRLRLDPGSALSGRLFGLATWIQLPWFFTWMYWMNSSTAGP